MVTGIFDKNGIEHRTSDKTKVVGNKRYYYCVCGKVYKKRSQIRSHALSKVVPQ